MAKARRRKAENQDIAGPTPEQMARADYAVERQMESGHSGKGRRFRKVRQLEALLKRSVITQSQFSALKHYRHHADIAERSLTKDSLAKWQPRGGAGNGVPFEVLNAVRIASDIERSVGNLADILRAVSVDDLSLSEWAMARYGSREKCERNNAGDVVCYVGPKSRGLAIATLEFKYVAGAVEAWRDY